MEKVKTRVNSYIGLSKVVSSKRLLVDCKMTEMSDLKLSCKRILMLSLISSSSKKGWLGITKLQKLSFLIEYFLMEKGKRAFGYEFFMYDRGPISRGVYQDYESLLDRELVDEDEEGIRPTEYGNNINKQFTDLIPEEINSIIRYVVDNYAHMKTHELVNIVHNMEIELPSGVKMRIDDIDVGCVVLPGSLDTAFKIEKNYMETFFILSNKSLMKAIRAARRNGSKSKPYKPLFS